MIITARTIKFNLNKIHKGDYVVIDGKTRCKRTFKRADFKNITMAHLYAKGYVHVSNSHLMLTETGRRFINKHVYETCETCGHRNKTQNQEFSWETHTSYGRLKS